MQYKKNLIFVFLIIIQVKNIFAEEWLYKDIKNKISSLENSIIQDFNIDLPPEESNRYGADYSRAATQLAVKYEIQKKLFYKIEYNFFQLAQSIDEHLSKNELNYTEAEKLRTNIEYATRIIMKSRMSEIHEIYLDLRSSLTHGPKLKEVYSQIKKMNLNNCVLETIDLNEKDQILSFGIKTKNKFGSWTQSDFTITQKDISAGRLLSMPDFSHTSFPYNRFITNYWTSQNSKDEKKFSLHLDHFGSIVAAEFADKKEEPLIKIMGINLGSQIVDKKIDCHDSLRRPANTKN